MWQRIQIYILKQEKVGQPKNDMCVHVRMYVYERKSTNVGEGFFNLYYMTCDIIHDKEITNYLDKL